MKEGKMVSLIDRFKLNTSDKTQRVRHHDLSSSRLYADEFSVLNEAIVTRLITPEKAGQIKFQGSWWTARSQHGITIPTGTMVYVIGRQNITLYVELTPTNITQGH